MNETVKLVARRELTERIRERSFLISTGITLAIVVIVLLLPALLGFGGPNEYTVAAGSPEGRAIVERAAQIAPEFDAKVSLGDSDPDASLGNGVIRAEDAPDDKLVSILQVADRRPAARRRCRCGPPSPWTRTRTPRPAWRSSRS